jgi:sterol desaturase/sphingolipid hydroxylase (fatty acid hydroxylase superfamily)
MLKLLLWYRQLIGIPDLACPNKKIIWSTSATFAKGDDYLIMKNIIIFSFKSFLLFTLLLYIYLTFSKIIHEPSKVLLFADGISSEVRSHRIEHKIKNDAELIINFSSCKMVDGYSFKVGNDGADSLLRLPKKFEVYIPRGEEWDLHATENEIEFIQGVNYKYYLQSNSCLTKFKIKILELSGSDILRLENLVFFNVSAIEKYFFVAAPNNNFIKGLTYLTKSIMDFIESNDYLGNVINPLSFTILILIMWNLINKDLFSSNFYIIKLLQSSSRKKEFFCTVFCMLGLNTYFTITYSFGFDHIVNLGLEQLKIYSIKIFTENLYIDLVIYFIYFTFADYWIHRLVHLPLFWPIHRFHHAISEYNTLITFRHHPIFYTFESILRLILFVFIPLPHSLVGIWPLIGFLFTTHQIFIHTDLDWDFGWIGKYIIVTPKYHRLHHSSIYYNSNYGNFFIFWDLLFRTYNKPPAFQLNIVLCGKSVANSKFNIIKEWFLDLRDLIFYRYR